MAASLADSAIANKLLEAAVRLFAHKGYRATSTREIVEAAGVTKPMLYYYFQSKEGLLAAALAHFMDAFHERLRQVVAEEREPYEQLVELVWAHLDFCQEHKPLARLFYALYFGPDDQKGLVDLKQYTEPGHELLMQGVARALATRLVRGDCEAELGMALHGMINIWVMAALNEELTLTHDLAQRIIDDLLRGYRKNLDHSPALGTGLYMHSLLNMTRATICRAALSCLGLALVLGCNRDREALPAVAGGAAAPSTAIKVTVQPVTFRSVQRTVGLVGTLHGYEEISLGAKVEGRVRKITHDVADRVKPGEVLLEIDPTDYQLNVRQAQRALQVELAKLGLEESPVGKVDVTRVPTVVQAQLRRDNAQKRMERAKTLVERKASAEEDLSEKMSEFRVAQAEYDNQVLVAKAGIAAIQVKHEALSIAKQQLLDSIVRVPEPSQPVPGLENGASYAIISRAVSEGSYVKAGSDVFKIVIESPLKFRGRVPERKSSEVRLGQKAEVYTAAYPRSFPGEVTRINPSIDPQTRTFEVEILVPNTQSELKPGGFAKTAILTEVDERAATVPLEAPVQVAGVTKIFLVEDGHAKEVQVTLGVQGSDWVEIATPKLPADAQVVTSGQTAIADRSAVAVRDSAVSTPGTSSHAKPSEPSDVSAAPVARRETAP